MQPDTPQLALWRSELGRACTDRNEGDKPERVAAWRTLLDGIAPARVLEVGCNVGWNLVYLERLGIADLYGIEPQPDAVERARQRLPRFNVLHGTAFDLPFRDRWFDLVFAVGALLHVAHESPGDALDEMFRVARRWIIAIEPNRPADREIAYRDRDGTLCTCEDGSAWQARYPSLRRVRRLELGAEHGYDDCTAHLFEKA